MMHSIFSIFLKEMIRIDLKEEIVKYICMTSLVSHFDYSILILLFNFVWLLLLSVKLSCSLSTVSVLILMF